MKVVTGERAELQGDILIMRVDALPKDAKKVTSNIVAHSETGHHHVAENAQVWDVGDPLTLFLTPKDAKKGIDLVHQRDWDTHETIRLFKEGGERVGPVYIIKKQRETRPDGWARVQD